MRRARPSPSLPPSWGWRSPAARPRSRAACRKSSTSSYQDIKLRFSGDQIAVRWTRPRGSGEDAVLEVSEKLDGLTVRTGD